MDDLNEACKDCGSTENLNYGPDPYLHEICDDDTEYIMCEDCIKNACDDI